MAKLPGDPGYRAGWCIHYRYDSKVRHMADMSCDAGVRYGNIAGNDDRGIMKRLPCFLNKADGTPTYPDARPCPKFRAPTKDEIAAHEQWSAARMETLATVITGILPWRQRHKGRSAAEVVECPACKGRLHLSIAAYNGHVHGRCETAGCVAWME